MNATWAGSVHKRTYVGKYSDGDIWIETRGITIDESLRQVICKEISSDLRSLGKEVIGPVFKPTATAINISDGRYDSPQCYYEHGSSSFAFDNHDFDMIFSNCSWVEQSLVIAPNDSGFFQQLNRQRAVKALKILSRGNPSCFPEIAGLQLERLVLCQSIDLDKLHCNHVEYASGLLLFRTCLFSFVLSDSADGLVRLITRSELNNPQSLVSPDNAVWNLSSTIYDSWKRSGAVLLALIHEIRLLLPMSHGIIDRYHEALSGDINEHMNKPTLLDSSNRVVFTV